MYFLDYSGTWNTPIYKGGTLRIGAFGATRPQKNLMSAAGVALQLHEELKVETEFSVSGGRLEGGGNTILNSVRAMCVRVPGFTLKELGWATWPQFRDVVRFGFWHHRMFFRHVPATREVRQYTKTTDTLSCRRSGSALETPARA